MRKLISYIMIFLFFLGPTVYAYLGWQVEGINEGSKYQQFYPNYFILLFAIAIYYLYNFKKISDISLEIKFTLLTIFSFVFLKFLGIGVTIMVVFNSVGLPVLVSAFLCSLNKGDTNQKKIMRDIVILMFILVSFLAIYERIALVHFFPLELAYEYASFEIDEDRLDLFRSSSLLGHPLSNALVITTVMSFILVSNFKDHTKYILFAIGFVALLCFNARAAIAFSVLALIMYECYNIYKRRVSRGKIILLSVLACGVIVAIPILIENGLGGRLFDDSSKSENSILARIVVWELLGKLDISTIFFGLKGNLTDLAESVLGNVHVENWFILMAIKIGGIFSLIFIVLMILLLKKNLIGVNRFRKYFTLGITFLLASTNNSLATGVQVISIYLICAYVFFEHRNIVNFKNRNVQRKILKLFM